MPPIRTLSSKTRVSAKAPAGARRVYRSAAERRGEIIAAAQSVFVRSNLQGARTRDIANEAGVNEATLFKHFPSKEALFEAAVMQPLRAAMQGMQERLDSYKAARTPEEMGRFARDSTVRHLQDMEQILPLLTTALFSDLEMGRKLYRQHLEPLIRERGKVLRPLTKSGIDPEFVGLATFGMLFAIAVQRRLGHADADLKATAVQFNRLSTGGFARAKGGAKKGKKRRVD